MASPKRTTKRNTISMDQFRSWLEGVEDMQPADWTPDQEQWRRIREKIDLVDVSLSEPTNATHVVTQRQPQVQAVPALPPMPPRVGTQFDHAQIVGGVPQIPTAPSAMETAPAQDGNPFGSFE